MEVVVNLAAAFVFAHENARGILFRQKLLGDEPLGGFGVFAAALILRGRRFQRGIDLGFRVNDAGAEHKGEADGERADDTPAAAGGKGKLRLGSGCLDHGFLDFSAMTR